MLAFANLPANSALTYRGFAIVAQYKYDAMGYGRIETYWLLKDVRPDEAESTYHIRRDGQEICGATTLERASTVWNWMRTSHGQEA